MMLKKIRFPGLRRSFLIILFPCFIFNLNHAFSQQVIDTLEMVRQLRDQKKLKEALSLVKSYYSNHPGDFNTNWLYGQVSYYSGHIRKSKSLYEKAIRLAPDNLYLQLDYAGMLVRTGEYEKAQPFLKKYLDYDPGNVEAEIDIAWILSGKCQYNEALQKLEQIKNPGVKKDEFNRLQQDIRIARSPWIHISEGFLADNQPLTYFSSQADAGFYLHPLSFPKFSLDVPLFFSGSKASPSYWLQAGNVSVISKPGIKIELDAGVVKFPVLNRYSWTGNISFEKTFLRHLVVAVQGEYRPYFATLSSIDTSIMEEHFMASLSWNDQKKWMGNATFDLHYYPCDRNPVYSFNGWVFVPPVRFSVFEVRFGYGFNYSTSRDNRFVSTESLPEILVNYDANASIPGIYNPYFTPVNQQIHSALLSVRINPVRDLSLGVNANFGFYATADVPYLYLDRNGSGQLYIARGFFNKNFFPGNVSVYVDARVAKSIWLHGEYAYFNTLFFVSNYAGIGINIHFLNEKKKR